MTPELLNKAIDLDNQITQLSCLIDCIQQSTGAKLYREFSDKLHGTFVPNDLYEQLKKEMISRYTEKLDELKKQLKEL